MKTNQKKFLALTQKVEYLTECVEKLTSNLRKSESLPCGIPGSSRFPGSQEKPIILSSDEEIKIKVEKSATSEMEIDSSKPTKVTSKTLSKRAKEKAPVRTSSSSSSSDSLSSSDDSDSQSSSDNPSVPFYFKKEDMPKSLREALRVNKDITY